MADFTLSEVKGGSQCPGGIILDSAALLVSAQRPNTPAQQSRFSAQQCIPVDYHVIAINEAQGGGLTQKQVFGISRSIWGDSAVLPIVAQLSWFSAQLHTFSVQRSHHLLL